MAKPDANRSSASGDVQTRPLQPEDILRLRSASDAEPSPDGQRIAYVVGELDVEGDREFSSIWLVPSSGGAPRRLSSGLDSSSYPRWSPDGQTLAYLATGERGPQIWLLQVDDGQPIRLTDVPGGVTGPPVWSPAEARIAFTARASASEPMAPGAPRVIRRLRYMLDGDGFIGDRFWHVFSVTAGQAHPAAAVQLTHGEWHHFGPAWSPDGASITCITTRRDDWDTEWIWDLYVFDANDPAAAPRLLSDSQRVCAAPAWSPDGRWIAYYANECPFTAYTQDYYLWIVPALGGPARNVTRSLDRGCQASQPPSINEPPRWSADSTTVFCRVREGGFYHQYAYDVAGDQLSRILGSSDIHDPIDGLVRQSLDGDLLAFGAATAVRPAELFTAHADGTNRRQLTDLNALALDSTQLSAPRRLTHTSPEGWQIETWLWLPPTFSDGDPPLPAVLYYHGGPHNTVTLGFNEQLHVLAGAGFAVIAVNFRGSTGFGTAFADSILHDWGTRELEDGLASVDALVQQGSIDPQRLGVYGGSYGGFMTNLALGRTDRFAAGVSYATISGLDSWGYQTDHWESADWDAGGPPWRIPEYYRTHSPITYVEHIRAPLLILHGEQDYRCAVAEADQLFGALRKLKRKVELVRYPGGPHAFSHVGPPSHRLDAMRRIVDWFQRYLEPGSAEPRDRIRR